MRNLSMNELAVVAGGDNTLPTVTVTYNKAANTTYYYMEGSATGHLVSNTNDADGGGGAAPNNMKNVEANLQLAALALAVAAAATVAIPPLSASLGVSAAGAAGLSFVAGAYK